MRGNGGDKFRFPEKKGLRNETVKADRPVLTRNLFCKIAPAAVGEDDLRECDFSFPRREAGKRFRSALISDEDLLPENKTRRFVRIDDQMIVPVGIDGSESGKTLCRRFCGIIEPLCRRIGFALFPRAGTFRKRSGTFGRSIAGICLRLEDYSQQPGLRISERITSPFAVVEELGVFRAGDFLLSIEGFNRFAGPLKKIEPVCGGTVLPPFRKEKRG